MIGRTIIPMLADDTTVDLSLPGPLLRSVVSGRGLEGGIGSVQRKDTSFECLVRYARGLRGLQFTTAEAISIKRFVAEVK